jgi:Flp pilus assembly protein TadG
MLTRLREFLKARDGMAAIEFAFIAPVLGTLLLGSIEASSALECRQKVTMLASSAADLVAQTASVSSSDMTNIFNAVTAIVYPFPQGSTTIVISSVMSDGSGNGTVAWSKAQNGTQLVTGSAITLPSPIMSTLNADGKTYTPCAKNACSVILAQITYHYTSPIGRFLVGSISMSDHFYARPRKSASVAYTG